MLLLIQHDDDSSCQYFLIVRLKKNGGCASHVPPISIPQRLSPAALPCSAGPTPWPTVPPAAPRRAALVPAPRCCRTWGQRPGQGVAKRGTNVENMGKKMETCGRPIGKHWENLVLDQKATLFKNWGVKKKGDLGGTPYLFGGKIHNVVRENKTLGNWASRSNSDLWMRSLAKPPETTETTWLSEHRLPRSIHLQ